MAASSISNEVVNRSKERGAFTLMGLLRNEYFLYCVSLILFFGGWQIPGASTELLRSHATDILYYMLLGLSVMLVLGGLRFLLKKPKIHYGDARDQEGKKLGIPALLLGIALLVWQISQGPLVLNETGAQIAAAIWQFGFFLLKIIFFCWFFVWVRWTLPRFRYDQLMKLGWRYMLPLALLNLVVTAGVYLMI